MKMLNHQQCNEFLVAYSNIAKTKKYVLDVLEKRLRQILHLTFSKLLNTLAETEKIAETEKTQFKLLADNIADNIIDCFSALYSCQQAGINNAFPAFPTPEQANSMMLYPDILCTLKKAGIQNSKTFLGAQDTPPITWLKINLSKDIENIIPQNFSLEYIHWLLYYKLILFLWRVYQSKDGKEYGSFANKVLKS